MSLGRRRTPTMPLHYYAGKTEEDRLLYLPREDNSSEISERRQGRPRSRGIIRVKNKEHNCAENQTGKVIIPAQVFEELSVLVNTYGVDTKDYYALKNLSFNLGFKLAP